MAKIASIIEYLNIDKQLDMGAKRSQSRPFDNLDSSDDFSDSNEDNSSDSSNSGDLLTGFT